MAGYVMICQLLSWKKIIASFVPKPMVALIWVHPRYSQSLFQCTKGENRIGLHSIIQEVESVWPPLWQPFVPDSCKKGEQVHFFCCRQATAHKYSQLFITAAKGNETLIV